MSVQTEIISTHAPAGGATMCHKASGLHRDHFYSRPCGRGDLCLVALGRDGVISTHAPAGGATRTRRRRSRWPLISTHAPAGGATGVKPEAFVIDFDFYSRPCGRGDAASGRMRGRRPYFYSRPCGRGDGSGGGGGTSGYQISTHAPAGGATARAVGDLDGLCISTHAPAGGATLAVLHYEKRRRDFYSRPCGRGDHRLQAGLPHHPRISTHAPAGGAT